MRAEYDFTGGVRGKYYKAMQAGYTITISNVTKESLTLLFCSTKYKFKQVYTQ